MEDLLRGELIAEGAAKENGDAYECVEQLPKPEPTRVSDIPQKETQKAKKGFWKKIMGS